MAIYFAIILPAFAADVVVLPHGFGRHKLALSGPIVQADQCRVAQALDRDPTITAIEINSPGGDAWAGARLARIIGWAGIDVVVPTEARAHSAAAIAVMGGGRRVIVGQIAFHAPYLLQHQTHASGRAAVVPRSRQSGAGAARMSEVGREVRDVLRLGGLPPSMIDAIMQVGPNSLHVVEGRAIESFRSSHPFSRDRLASLAATCRRAAYTLRTR